MPRTSAAGDVPANVQGFDALAELLTKEFNALIPGNKRPGNTDKNNNVSNSNAKTNTAAVAPDKTPKKRPTIMGTIVSAHKHLKTSFTSTIQGKRKSPTSLTAQPNANEPQPLPPAAAAFTPASSTNSATTTRSTRSNSSRNSVPTPIPMATEFAEDDEFAEEDDEEVVPTIPLTSLYRGMRRIKLAEQVRLRERDTFVLVVPHAHAHGVDQSKKKKKKPKPEEVQRANLLDSIRRVVLDGITRLPKEERDALWASELNARTIPREGKECYEFHFTVNSYKAERDALDKYGLPPRYVKSLIKTGMGMYITLHGFGGRRPLLLQYKMLPYVEVYVQRRYDEPFLDDSIAFPKTDDEDRVVDYMTTELHAAKGDTVAYVNIMMKYYQHVNSRRWYNTPKHAATPQSSSSKKDAFSIAHEIRNAITLELNHDSLVDYARMVDTEYHKRMIDCASNWTAATPHLISPERIAHFYSQFEERFPYCHSVIATIVSTKYYNIPINAGLFEFVEEEAAIEQQPEIELHRKKRMVLFAFFAMLRTKSRALLNHWAQIEPLGHYFKGVQQPGKQSFAGSFVSTLKTSFKHQDVMYELGIQRFNDKLRATYHARGAFDNHNKFIQKKTQTEGKASINQVGTAYYLAEDWPYELPNGTRIRSPNGVVFEVTDCAFIDNTSYYVTGEIVSGHTDQDTDGHIAKDCVLISNGIMWPTIGWKVESIPWFAPCPEVTYQRQEVPPPLRARVTPGVSDDDILFDRSRHIVDPDAEQSEILSSKRFYELSCRARRLADMRRHMNRLKQKEKDAKAAHDNYDDNDFTTREKPSLLQFDNKTKAFIKAVESASFELDAAAKFEKDIVKKLNPKTGEVNKMFVFPISPHCETSHSGMKKVFAEMGESFKMFEIDEYGKTNPEPNSNVREINLMVDQLSSRNFRQLRFNLSKKLSEVGSAPYILPILESLDQYTVQHDYLHEIRMHRAHCIWKTKYGAFLQPMQAHLSKKRITGEPQKTNMQGHESFMLLVYNSLHDLRWEQFIASQDNEEDFVATDDRRACSNALCIEANYHEYCQQWEEACDEPSRVAALYMKEVESYNRAFYGVRNQNFWINEIEDCMWIGAHKLCGKSNYLHEALHRIDTMYGPMMSDEKREWLRNNRFFVMSEGGRAMSLDEVNELINAWNKRCVDSLNFGQVRDRSKHLMVGRMCAHEAFGTNNYKSRPPSQKEDMEKLKSFLQQANIFPLSDVVRPMTDNVFWDLVRKTKVGSERDANKEYADIEIGQGILFDVLTKSEGERDDVMEVWDELGEDEDAKGDDDDNISTVSSCIAGSVSSVGNLVEDENEPGDLEEEDCDTFNAKDRDSMIRDTLNKLGCGKRKKMSALILKDMLGEDGDATLKGIKKKHVKKTQTDNRRIEEIHMSVRYFEQKMAKRRQLLHKNIKNSKEDTYERKKYSWRNEYKEMRRGERD